jgi:hypothetical protein
VRQAEVQSTPSAPPHAPNLKDSSNQGLKHVDYQARSNTRLPSLPIKLEEGLVALVERLATQSRKITLLSLRPNLSDRGGLGALESLSA